MKTTSERELRDDAAAVMRCDRPATRRPDYTSAPRVDIQSSTAELLDDLRGDR